MSGFFLSLFINFTEKMARKYSEKKSKKEQKELKKNSDVISESVDFFKKLESMSPHEKDRMEKQIEFIESNKIRWPNMDISAKINSISTLFLILTAIVALFFQWHSNITTDENLQLLQKEFELTYRPYIAAETSSYKVEHDSLSIYFTLKNLGNVPAIIKINSQATANNQKIDMRSTVKDFILFPGNSIDFVENLKNSKKIERFDIDYVIVINYNSNNTKDFIYSTVYSCRISETDPKIKYLNITAN